MTPAGTPVAAHGLSMILRCLSVVLALLTVPVVLSALRRASGGHRADWRWPIAAALLLSVAFMLIAVQILARGPLLAVDAAFSRAVFSHRLAWLDPVMVAITALGDGAERTVGTIVLVGFLLWRRRPREALALATVMIGAALLTPTFKTLFHIARPSALYAGAEAFSFPSGHATSAAAFYGLLAVMVSRDLNDRARWAPWAIAVTMVLLTAMSRIYVGAHWLSDVLASLALGAVLALIGAVMIGQGRGELVRSAKSPMVDGWVMLAIVIVVGAGLGPTAFRKAERLYGPYLARPAGQAVDPAHTMDPRAPIVQPPNT